MSSDSDSQYSEAYQASPHPVQAILRFARVLWRRKIYVATALLVACLLGTVYYLTATRMYVARASILILQTGAEVWGTSMSAEGSRNGLIPTYEELFTSAVVVKGAVDYLRASDAPVEADFAGLSDSACAGVIRRNLTARGKNDTNVIEITYRAKNPQTAKAVVAAVVDAYLEFVDQNHKHVSAEIVSILDRERQEVQTALTAKERELAEARRRVGDLGIGGESGVVHPAVERALAINTTLNEVDQQCVQLQASLRAVEEAVATGSDLRQHLIALEPQIGSDLVRSTLGISSDQRTITDLETKLMEHRSKRETLLQSYDVAHPAVLEIDRIIHNTRQYLDSFQENINERLARMSTSQLGPALKSLVAERLAQAVAYRQELQERSRQMQAEALQVNDRLTEVAIVDREVQRMQQLHDKLLDQITNIDIQQNQADVRMAVVSEPQASNTPVSPTLSRIVLLCVFGGLLCGAVLVYVIDVLDDRFRSPEELAEQLATQVLSVVRTLPPCNGTGADALLVRSSPDSAECEAFRTLRTTLKFSGRECDRLAITSPEPTDGKTTVIANLAASYAQVHKRTLLIDADLRRPGLSRLFALRGQPGLSDVLRSDEPVPELCSARVMPGGIDHLFILPCGPKPGDPQELLSDPRMEDVIAWAETHFDQVLIDSPPVLAASDASIVGRLVDGVILVVQPQKNHRRLVLRAVAGLRSMGVHLIGVVANRVAANKDAGYDGFGYGYGYGYGQSYGGGAEDDLDHRETNVIAVGPELSAGGARAVKRFHAVRRAA